MNNYGTYNIINVVDAIRAEVAKMAAKVSVSNIQKVGDIYRITCLNTRRLVNYMYVRLSDTTNFNTTYRIENVTSTTFDIFENADISDELNISAFWNLDIQFIHGSYASMYQQLENLNKFEKTQVIGLHERFTTKVNRPSNGIYKQPVLKLIFCTPYFDAWSEDAHDLYAIKPLENLCDLFVNVANINNEYTEEICKRYGKFNVFKGNEAHILGKVDAIELTDLEYTILASYKCEY